LNNELEKLCELTTDQQDPTGFRRKAWKTAAAVLKGLRYKVTYDNVQLLISIKGIGKGTSYEKILEILDNGELMRAREQEKDPRRIAIAELKSVWGLGELKATYLVDQHQVMSVAALRERVQASRLSAEAFEGNCTGVLVPPIVERTLEVHEDLQLKIPRVQVNAEPYPTHYFIVKVRLLMSSLILF
jgi:hypothetical protein